ncbi:hypothetical protein [Rhodopirellula sp. JC639]|uniref:hypothetical protein n=1 Tax=Stieleria mannarensis TaxID=2755585 RepID=UPI0015FECFEA|nr:hypothetical protein [Rhodopirellula sp. JC639]
MFRVDALFDRCEFALFKCFCDRSANRIKFHVGCTGQQRFLVVDSNRSVAILPKPALCLVGSVGALGDPLVEQADPPTDARMTFAYFGELDGAVANRIEFRLGRFGRLAVDLLQRADHQPASRHFGIAPGGNHVRASAEDQMGVIRENRIAEQIDAEIGGKVPE